MPCLAQEYHHPKIPATNHYCKSLSSLIRETYAHCHVPCARIPAAGWSSGEDSDDDDGSCLDDMLDTKQVILNEMRNRQMRKRSRCSVDSPTPSSAFAWSLTPLDPRSVLEKFPSPKESVSEEEKMKGKEEEEEVGEDDVGGGGDDESEAFFSVKSFFSRSTSRGATVASSTFAAMDPPPPLQSPAAWGALRGCDGWPFGLCRLPAVLPPLPSSPADSWQWRKRSSSSNHAASPAPAYSYYRTTPSRR
ncbi:uncharacterized protein LOC102708556 [Oryza brachyantha]|uniref:uncharacterized protein LOC102708556 n=1 Tax=Oryza brachyantha TaxID=4533 RepID=UPI001AD96778|nr:uncharacterized protein LOC102708556 [Oryza brachyantha]